MEVVAMLRPAVTQSTKNPLAGRASRWLWAVAVLDMMAVVWMITAGRWLDQTGGYAAAVTLGGHHELVLIMAAVGFVMLAGLAVLTAGFTSASKLEIGLISIACTISVAALAGALSAVLLLVSAALMLGFAGRLLFRG
jgi:hypothetical protein